jgi:hypothetical protein
VRRASIRLRLTPPIMSRSSCIGLSLCLARVMRDNLIKFKQ